MILRIARGEITVRETKRVARRSNRLDQETADRLALIAKVDNRTLAQAMAMAIRAGLPILEAQLESRQQALRAEPTQIKIGTQKKQAA